MGDRENGYWGSGNQPHPNNVQANYDYWAGQNQRAAEQRASEQRAQQARDMANQAQAQAAAQAAAFRSAAPPINPYAGGYAGTSSAARSSPSFSPGGFSGRSSGSVRSTVNSQPSSTSNAATRRSAPFVTPIIAPSYKLSWSSLIGGCFFGATLGLLPFILTAHLYPSVYMGKLVLSMALFISFVTWAFRELTNNRPALAIGLFAISYGLPSFLTFGPWRSFLIIWVQFMAQAANHLHI